MFPHFKHILSPTKKEKTTRHLNCTEIIEISLNMAHMLQHFPYKRQFEIILNKKSTAYFNCTEIIEISLNMAHTLQHFPNKRQFQTTLTFPCHFLQLRPLLHPLPSVKPL